MKWKPKVLLRGKSDGTASSVVLLDRIFCRCCCDTIFPCTATFVFFSADLLRVESLHTERNCEEGREGGMCLAGRLIIFIGWLFNWIQTHFFLLPFHFIVLLCFGRQSELLLRNEIRWIGNPFLHPLLLFFVNEWFADLQPPPPPPLLNVRLNSTRSAPFWSLSFSGIKPWSSDPRCTIKWDPACTLLSSDTSRQASVWIMRTSLWSYSLLRNITAYKYHSRIITVNVPGLWMDGLDGRRAHIQWAGEQFHCLRLVCQVGPWSDTARRDERNKELVMCTGDTFRQAVISTRKRGRRK